MKIPNFTDPQYLDANGVGGLNNAMSAISGAIAGVGSGAWAVPGLLSPEVMTVGFAGMVANIGLPQPWGLVAPNGTIVHAHGTQTGADTTSYSVNFAPLVPSSGSVTAYLAATIALIQQNPFPIPGPTEGNSGFNPNYVSTNGYATNTYSIALAAVTGAVIDNVNTFELFRTTVTAGQTVLSAYSTIGQVRAGDRKAYAPLVLASGGLLAPWQAQYVLSPASPGLTFTLPPASGCGGLTFDFANLQSGSCAIVPTASDPIYGFGLTPLSSLTLPGFSALSLFSNGANGFLVRAMSPDILTSLANTWLQPQTFTDPGLGGVIINGSGSASGANLEFIGPGATTPKKWIRVLGGVMQWINNAYSTIIATLDDSGNFTVPGTLTGANAVISPGSVSVNANIAANGNIIGGYVQSNGLVLALGNIQANLRLIAINGAYGTGNPNFGVILNDFLNWSPGSTGYQIFPNGLIIQWGSGLFGNGLNQPVNLPITFPNAILFADGSFASEPTPNNYVGVSPANNSQVYVGLVATVNNTVNFWAIGY